MTAIRQQAEAILQSGALGKSDAFARLLRFLADKAESGKAVKEIEIAIEVFGRDETFDVTQDSLVRVYIHKLRSKLADYYAGPGKHATEQLYIPKGSYILSLATPAELAAKRDPVTAPRGAKWRGVGAGTLLATLLAALFISYGLLRTSTLEPLDHALWNPLLAEGRPLTILLGEVFVYSELNAEFEQLREVRDFSIHSATQFHQLTATDPALTLHQRDLGVRYLPAATGAVLNQIAKLLGQRISWETAMASELEQRDFSGHNLLYIGQFTGLQGLRDELFEGSAFTLHPNGTVLIDRNSGDVYVGQGQIAQGYRDRYLDYALFSRSQRSDGSWLYSIAAPRDAGLEQLSAYLTTAAGLNAQGMDGVRSEGRIEILAEISGDAENLTTQIRKMEAPQ